MATTYKKLDSSILIAFILFTKAITEINKNICFMEMVSLI